MNKSQNTEGFTLVELLVVVAIIILLASISIPVAARAKLQMAIRDAKHTVIVLKTASDGYITEYSRPPIPFGEMRSDTYEVTGDDLTQIIRILQGTNVVNEADADKIINNRERIIFLDVPEHKAGKDMLDPWDQHYTMVFDANLDGKLQFQGETYRVDTLVISKGRDGKLGTNDDLMSNR